jgi:hypothetical protein
VDASGVIASNTPDVRQVEGDVFARDGIVVVPSIVACRATTGGASRTASLTSNQVLRGMVAIRLHLDDCPQSNGPLLAMRRSFSWGRVAMRDLRALVDEGEAAAYPCQAGDVVAMRGLAVHASERAAQPGRRRVLHVDYATRDLPSPLTWAI